MDSQDIKSFLPHVPSRIEQLYSEVIKAHYAGLDLLCAAGLRMLLEEICKIEGAFFHESTTLYGAIDKLCTMVQLANVTRKQLRFVAGLGNDAIHTPTIEDPRKVVEALAIIETLLMELYSGQ